MEPEDEPYDPLFIPLSELGSKRRDRRFLRIVGKVLRLDWLEHKTLEVSLHFCHVFCFLFFYWDESKSIGWMKWRKIRLHVFTQERRSTIQRLLPSFARRCIDNDDFLSLQELLDYVSCRMHWNILLLFHMTGYTV